MTPEISNELREERPLIFQPCSSPEVLPKEGIVKQALTSFKRMRQGFSKPAASMSMTAAATPITQGNCGCVANICQMFANLCCKSRPIVRTPVLDLPKVEEGKGEHPDEIAYPANMTLLKLCDDPIGSAFVKDVSINAYNFDAFAAFCLCNIYLKISDVNRIVDPEEISSICQAIIGQAIKNEHIVSICEDTIKHTEDLVISDRDSAKNMLKRLLFATCIEHDSPLLGNLEAQDIHRCRGWFPTDMRPPATAESVSADIEAMHIKFTTLVDNAVLKNSLTGNVAMKTFKKLPISRQHYLAALVSNT